MHVCRLTYIEQQLNRPACVVGSMKRGLIVFSSFQLWEKHFVASDYITTSRYTDVKMGKIVEVPLKVAGLKRDSVPGVFPNCLQYLSCLITCTREALEERRKRLEDDWLRSAIQKSPKQQHEQDKKNKVTNVSDLLLAVKAFGRLNFGL